MTEQAVGCPHVAYGDTSHCAVMWCPNYISKCVDHNATESSGEQPEQVRHYFHVPSNNALASLCGSKVGVIRMDLSNVDCKRCLAAMEAGTTAVLNEPEKLYLVCNGCGEACDSIETAREHGVRNPQSLVWCGDDGFVIQSESEAL